MFDLVILKDFEKFIISHIVVIEATFNAVDKFDGVIEFGHSPTRLRVG